jgi:DUF971 family protein
MAQPLDIAHHRGRNVLEITWDDGSVSELPIPYLRGWCPCASCQGHGSVVRHQPPDSEVQVQGIFEMGAYAIGIRFSDGHDSGIFSWSWLRQIAPETPPVGLKRGSFVNGTYRVEDVSRHDP